MARPRLAKLTRPRLSRAIARERLFRLLDEGREHRPAICVIGPPGAGKTTLVATWLDESRGTGIWYQVDPGDADLPTFFYYLGQAAASFVRKGKRPLPLLTPEHLGDVTGFARRYFRELFGRLPSGATFVLDNYQEVPAGHVFHELVAHAVDEIPPGTTLIAVSRRDPPDCYSRLMANERVAIIDAEALKLTLEEAQGIGARRLSGASHDIASLYEMSEGWAAGFTLLLERLRQGEFVDRIANSESLRGVFDYFAGQLFERIEGSRQRLLLMLSVLPRISESAARELCGSEEAVSLLEDMHRRHLFTDRRHVGEPVYQFHALLQAFLQHRASQTLTLPEQSQLTKRAARILEGDGQVEEALTLYARSGEFDGARRLILEESQRLIRQGRWKVVTKWIEALPAESVERDCWLMHWLGTAQIAVAPLRARSLLERSAALAEQAGDPLCRLQAAAGVVQTYMLEYTHYYPLDAWIDVLQAGVEQQVAFPTPEAELRIQSALLIALSYRRPSSSALLHCAPRVLELSLLDGEINLRLLGAAYVVAYGATTGPLELANAARPVLERLLEHPEITVLTATWGWFMVSYLHMVLGNERECMSAVRRLERIGVEERLPAATRLAAVLAGWLELGAGRLAAAWQWLSRLEEVVVPGHLYDEASVAALKAALYAFQGEVDKSAVCAAKAVALYDAAGSHFHRCYSRTQLAWCAIFRGDANEARRWLDEALAFAQATRTGWLEVEVRLAEASLALEGDDEASAERTLRRAFELGRQVDCIWAFKFSRAWMPRLCAAALNADIEVDYVRRVVHGMALPPPVPEPESWPWPVKIRALGGFEVVVHDQPLTFAHKTPRKPLGLLKALIAHGGADVSEQRLIDALWRDEEGDAGRKAYSIALHRLRDLLGVDGALTVESGALSLNRALCRVDVWNLEHAILEADARLRSGDLDEFLRMAVDVRQLYRGPFLPGDGDADWAVPLRERLRGRFVQTVENAARQLETRHRVDEARDWYLGGLEADELTEAFYQGLMRCYEASGRRPEALSVFRRLRQTLSVTLGVKPSPQSEALYRRLLAS